MRPHRILGKIPCVPIPHRLAGWPLSPMGSRRDMCAVELRAFARATRPASHRPLGPRRVRAHSPVGSRCLGKPKLSMPACVTLYPTQPRARTLESRLRLWPRPSGPLLFARRDKNPIPSQDSSSCSGGSCRSPRTGRLTSSRDRGKTAAREQKQKKERKKEGWGGKEEEAKLVQTDGGTCSCRFDRPCAQTGPVTGAAANYTPPSLRAYPPFSAFFFHIFFSHSFLLLPMRRDRENSVDYPYSNWT